MFASLWNSLRGLARNPEGRRALRPARRRPTVGLTLELLETRVTPAGGVSGGHGDLAEHAGGHEIGEVQRPEVQRLEDQMVAKNGGEVEAPRQEDRQQAKEAQPGDDRGTD